MNIKLRNIGKVKEANIDIDGITVITGYNNSGKSTISKALYSVFNSFYNAEEKINSSIMLSLSDAVRRYSGHSLIRFFRKEELEDLLILRQSREITKSDVSDLIRNFLEEHTSRFFASIRENGNNNEIVDRIIDDWIKIINSGDEEILNIIISNQLNLEFGEQIRNIYNQDEGEILLELADENINVKIKKEINHVSSVKSLWAKSIYIDTPYILEDDYNYVSSSRIQQMYSSKHHRHNLFNLINSTDNLNEINELVSKKKSEKIFEKLDEIIPNKIYKAQREFVYQEEEGHEPLKLKNLSTGLKTFAIIKLLLENAQLREREVLILDEPEIHLHPEWQIVLAELIVLLSTELNLHILINTHSPYFLEAIEVFSQKYNIQERTRFYESEEQEDGVIFNDITNEIDKVYKRFVNPLKTLDKVLGEVE